jgi:hypothetical protein
MTWEREMSEYGQSRMMNKDNGTEKQRGGEGKGYPVNILLSAY